MRRLLVASILLLSLAVVMPVPSAGAPPPASAVRGLCDDYWQGYLQAHPTYATSIGDQRYDSVLPDNTPEARDREIRRVSRILDRVRAVNPLELSAEDQVNRACLIEACEDDRKLLSCLFDDWVVDANNGPLTEFNNLPDLTRIDSPADGRRYVMRLKAMPAYLDQYARNLQRGLTARRVATHTAVQRMLAALDTQIAMPITEWPLYRPVLAERSSWPAAEKIKFNQDVNEALQYELEPAVVRLRAFLASRVMPAARSDDKPGIVNVPGGVEAYRMCIHVHTSLETTADEVHTIGLQKVSDVRGEMMTLGKKLFGTSDLAVIQEKLRTDTTLHFSSAQEIEDKARATLARARAAIPQDFGILPRIACEVKPIDPLEAPNSYVGYYREGASDGSRPAYYMVNTYQPRTRTRYDAEALAFHESIPGHHLQIAIASQLTGLPEFRRHLGVTAYVEGWALYSERLADEMGLYSSELDRLGMLSFDAWRACRLVVDTGIHAKGWTRQQAIDYMRNNTLLAENNIENEVDRYISWPGQALAYKLGQLEILRIRDDAKKKLGARFDIRAFHDALLKNGALPLPVLSEQMELWSIRQVAP